MTQIRTVAVGEKMFNKLIRPAVDARVVSNLVYEAKISFFYYMYIYIFHDIKHVPTQLKVS